MSVKGKIANFYHSKSKVVNALWILAQIVSVLLIIALIVSLFVSPATMAMGIVMKFYSLFVIALTLYMMLYKTMKEKLIRTKELYAGFYLGLCIMDCMNLVIISVLFGSQSNLIEITAGKKIAITLFRCVASCSIFIIFFYCMYIAFFIRHYSDILAENNGKKVELKEVVQPVDAATSAKASQELVLFKKPAKGAAPTPAAPTLTSQEMVLANKPALKADQAGAGTAPTLNAGGMSLVLANKPAAPATTAIAATTTGAPAGTSISGMMLPPGVSL